MNRITSKAILRIDLLLTALYSYYLIQERLVDIDLTLIVPTEQTNLGHLRAKKIQTWHLTKPQIFEFVQSLR